MLKLGFVFLFLSPSLAHCFYLINNYQSDKTISQMLMIAPDSDGKLAERTSA